MKGQCKNSKKTRKNEIIENDIGLFRNIFFFIKSKKTKHAISCGTSCKSDNIILYSTNSRRGLYII